MSKSIKNVVVRALALSLLGVACSPRSVTHPSVSTSGHSLNAQVNTRAANTLSAFSNQLPSSGAYSSFKVNPRLPQSDAVRKAVKITYLMTDDKKHQSPWSQKMLQMLDDLPQKNVHNLVFRDGKASGDSKLYYIEKGDTSSGTIRNAQSSLAPGVTEVQSNNPMVFSEVIKWSLDNYSGQRKYLQIYTHGGGFAGIGTDKNQVSPKGAVLPINQQKRLMSPSELNGALKRALRGRKIDVLYFRACLMGNFEALYELRDSVKYALASEDVSYSVENSNITMTRLFDDLASRGVEPREVARQMSIQAKAQNSGWRNGYTTMSAIDIDGLTGLKSSLNTLVKALNAASPRYGKQIAISYASVPFINEHAADYMIRDLWAFTSALLKNVPEPTVQAAVQRVRQSHEKAMVHTKDMFKAQVNGLSILMPSLKKLSDPNLQKYIKSGAYQQNRFARETAWDDFVLSLAKYSDIDSGYGYGS